MREPSADKRIVKKEVEPKTILVVDDDEDIIKLLRTQFQLESNHKVIAAVDGEQAVIITHRKQPDLILLDIAMPGLHGFSVMEKLKQSRLTEGIPIIIISAYSKPEYIQKAKELGALEFFTKPFDIRRLIECVKSVLE